MKVFQQLPLGESLTVEAVREVVNRTRENSKSRKRACMALGNLAEFAQLDCNLAALAGNYSPKRVSPRDLPSDTLIVEWFHKFKNPAWQWVYGMMAAYELRNHEAFRLDFELLQSGDRVLSVLKDTKTGSRRVWAYYPEWVEQFNLLEVKLPPINLDRSNERVGKAVTNYFNAMNIPFSPYALRHCWAVRTIGFGLPDTLASQQMGHTVAVHNTIYHHWVKHEHHQRVYEMLLSRGDRPQPPSLDIDPPLLKPECIVASDSDRLVWLHRVYQY